MSLARCSAEEATVLRCEQLTLQGLKMQTSIFLHRTNKNPESLSHGKIAACLVLKKQTALFMRLTAQGICSMVSAAGISTTYLSRALNEAFLELSGNLYIAEPFIPELPR